MRVKLGENLPARLADALAALGHDVDTVPNEGLQGNADPDIWDAAQRSQRFLVTQDLDFSDLRKFLPGSHHGILLVRLRHASRRYLTERIRQIFETEDVESWGGAFVVCTESKIRARRPGTSGR
jgi:predicted nuclease of predicted toxin-antitoxin system